MAVRVRPRLECEKEIEKLDSIELDHENPHLLRVLPLLISLLK